MQLSLVYLLKTLNGRSKTYAIGQKATKIIHIGSTITGAIDHVTVLSVVCGTVVFYKPVVVFRGREMNYRIVNDDGQTLLDFLPP